MEKRFFQAVGILLLLIVIWSIWQPLWKTRLNEAVDPSSTDKIVLDVEKGESASSIATSLKKEELIESKKSFLRTVEKEDLDGSLRYGRFVLSPSMTLREIITILTTEGTGELAITVIEGWTINEIDAKLTEMGLIEAGKFRYCSFNCTFEYAFLCNDRSLEGFLFPDTYFIDSASFTEETFINQMLQNFDAKLSDEMEAAITASGRSIHDTVIMASLIEREVRTEDDIPIVSGILWKRLDNEWTLGVDATLLYVQEDNELSAEDLAMESPYNTRLNKGLPPTGISNPGLASLEGAIYPEDSEYWFYLTNLEGEVFYAKTNEEHERNKEKHL